MADATVRDDQVLPGSSTFVDAKGQKGAVIDAGSLSYAVDNTAVATVSQPDPANPGDPNGFVINPVAVGSIVLSMKATSNAGATAISDSKTVDVTPGLAVSGTISFGAPR